MRSGHNPTNVENLVGRERIGGGSAWRLLLFSLFVFGVMVVAYLGLTWGYRPYLEAQIEARERQIADLATLMPQSERDKLTKLYFQVVNLKSILDKHVNITKLFPVMERFAHERVRFENASFDFETQTLTIDAVAASPDTFVQQIEYLKTAKEVAAYRIANMNTEDDGTVPFTVALTMTPDVVK